MNHSVSHLPGVEARQVRTSRLRTLVLLTGRPDGEPVLLLHGNLSAATFWEETMLALPESFRAAAPDQRGYGSSDPAARIDATRGLADWADDAIALADHLGWDRFHLIGHSLGGCVGWQLIGDQPQRLLSVTLVAPGPPGGFPGARGLQGEPNYADGAGSGAGLAHPLFIAGLAAGERGAEDPFSPRATMNRVYWQPPFRPAREEDLLTAMLQVHLGSQQFPGDWIPSPNWPGFAPGRYGPLNALSPLYNQQVLDRLLAAEPRPRLLWVYGTEDAIVTNQSISDPGQQGKLKLRPGWPGEQLFPPQPLLTQVEYALERYEQRGAQVDRLGLPEVGHTPYLERPLIVHAALAEHLLSPC